MATPVFPGLFGGGGGGGRFHARSHAKVLEGGRGPPKRFFRLGVRFMAAPNQEPWKKIKNRKKRKLMNRQLKNKTSRLIR